MAIENVELMHVCSPLMHGNSKIEIRQRNRVKMERSKVGMNGNDVLLE